MSLSENPTCGTVRDATRDDHLHRIRKVLRHIHAHLDKPLSIADLARLANLSPPHLNVVFRGLVGETIYQHLKRLRLERAASFLRLTGEPIVRISMACGFDSHEGFTRAFAQAFGCSPRAFRGNAKIGTDLAAPNNAHYRMAGIPEEFRPAPDLGQSLKVDIVELPPLRLAYRRHVGPYVEAYRAWPTLLWWAIRTHRINNDSAYYGLCYDDEFVTPPERQRYDAAMVVKDDFMGDGDIGVMTIDGGLFARATIEGNFAEYWRASDAFHCQWLPSSGYALRAIFALDRYHVAGNLLNPIRLAQTALKKLRVDMHLPIGPGPFGRSLLA